MIRRQRTGEGDAPQRVAVQLWKSTTRRTQSGRRGKVWICRQATRQRERIWCRRLARVRSALHCSIRRSVRSVRRGARLGGGRVQAVRDHRCWWSNRRLTGIGGNDCRGCSGAFEGRRRRDLVAEVEQGRRRDDSLQAAVGGSRCRGRYIDDLLKFSSIGCRRQWASNSRLERA